MGLADSLVNPFRYDVPECPQFECAAGKRPVQKQESDFKAYALDHCYNDGTQYAPNDSPYTPDVRLHFAKDTVAQCCFGKDLCVATCGISFEFCFKEFWKCAEMHCRADAQVTDESGYNGCLRLASENSASQIWAKRKPHFLGGPFLGGSTKKMCKEFLQVQAQACDCVPAGDLDKRLKQRAIDFFRLHAPELLNKKGEIKNSKVWSKWKGKRPEMMRHLMSDFNASVDLKSMSDTRPLRNFNKDIEDFKASKFQPEL